MTSVKRRRLDESHSTLSKPFKSPMLAKQIAGDSNAAHSTTTFAAGPSLPKSTLQSHAAILSPIRSTSSHSRPSTYTNDQDTQYLTLQKQHSALLQQLSHLRTSLETSQQAVKITSNATNDLELQNLIVKWRSAARAAAEELFRGACDRVKNMGGVAAWRERSRKQSSGWNDENMDLNEDGTEMSKAQKEARARMLENMQVEMERYGWKKEEEQVVEEEDDTFTMDMMLKQLSVELDVIGYNKARQQWI